MLKDKTIVVTGGASGIGFAAVNAFAGKGANVAFIDLQKEKGEQAREKCAEKGFKVDFYCGDVSESADVERIVGEVIDKRHRIDVLVNNAAVQMNATVEETKEEEWERIFDVNIKGYYLCAKSILPFMRKQKDGVIINLTSVQGIMPCPTSAAYASSKGAIITFTKTLALDYGSDNIRAVAIAPGAIDAPLLHKYNNAETIKKMKLAIPLNRLGKPEEMGELIAFMASGICSYISGSVIVADGGLSSYISF